MTNAHDVDATPADDGVAETDRGEAELAAIRQNAADLPRWRRPRELRRQLTATLIATSLASVLLVGGLNFVAARDLLEAGTQDKLTGIGTSRALTLEADIDRLLGTLSAVSSDLELEFAFDDFGMALDELDDAQLTEFQQAALDQYYEIEVEGRFDAFGVGPPTTDRYRPVDVAQRYLQYHYVVAPFESGVDPRSVVDPGDGSQYSAAHEVHHEALTAMLTESLDAVDAMLIDIDGEVIYSVDKRIDLGSNFFDGPYSNSALTELLQTQLPRVNTGQALIADVQLYEPAFVQPVYFAAVAVRSETEVVGFLAVELPTDVLTEITTSDRQWERFGLQSGESYVVGSDRILRTESRPWIENPDDVLSAADDPDIARLMEVLDTAVGLQEVDTEPVRAALAGNVFEGTSTNYLGTTTFTYAQPVDVPGVDWVVVVDVPIEDARSPLFAYARRLGLVLLVILPAAGLIGLWMARRLTRPIGPVLDAAGEILAGERDPDLPELGSDEFGDLARRLGNVAADIGSAEAALADESDKRRALMSSIVPTRLIDASGHVDVSTEICDIVTVVAIEIDTDGRGVVDHDRAAELLDQIAAFTLDDAEDRGIECARGSADRYLFLVGVGKSDDGADLALDFAREHRRRFRSLCDLEDVELGLRIGVATGPVAMGVLGSGSLTLGAWGPPIRRALTLGALSPSHQVVVDVSTVAQSTAVDELERTDDVVSLDDGPMQTYTLG